jgi:hypothetical protein
LREVVGGLRHRIVAELLLDLRVRETRADGRVEDAHLAAVGRLGLGHHERRAAHALDATGDEQVALARGDHLRGIGHRVQAARAVALEHRAADLDRQAGEQAGMARDAARVFAALVGAADHDVLELLGLEAAARHQFLHHAGEQVVGANAGQRAGVAADGGAESVVQVCVEHGGFLIRG